MGFCVPNSGRQKSHCMATVKINILDDPPDFSIVLGGPLFQLLRRAHLGGDHLELLFRRLVVFVGITWLPLFLLATVGRFAGSAGRLAFLGDIEVRLGLHIWTVVLAWSFWNRLGHLVCHAWGTLESHSGRHLVCVYKYSGPTVHSSSLVREIFNLVSLPLAGLKNAFELDSDASGSGWRAWVPWGRFLYVWAYSFRARRDAGGIDCQ